MLIIFILIYLYFFSTPPFYNILIGDIGGTNIRLKLLRMTKDINIAPLTLKSEYQSTFRYESLEILLKDFIAQLDPKSKPEYAVLGIPGPVENNQLLTLPNIPHWKLENGDILGQKLGIKKFIFLNDFVCNGYSIQTNLKENVGISKLNTEYLIISHTLFKLSKDSSLSSSILKLDIKFLTYVSTYNCFQLFPLIEQSSLLYFCLQALSQKGS